MFNGPCFLILLAAVIDDIEIDLEYLLFNPTDYISGKNRSHNEPNVAFSYATQHAMRPKNSAESEERKCLNKNGVSGHLVSRFPLPTLLYMGYSVKLRKRKEKRIEAF